jgi:hypothetical protein
VVVHQHATPPFVALTASSKLHLAWIDRGGALLNVPRP